MSNCRETISHLNMQIDALRLKCSKFEERARDFEDENIKHTNLHERMKDRLQELTKKTQEQHEQVRLNINLFLYLKKFCL